MATPQQQGIRSRLVAAIFDTKLSTKIIGPFVAIALIISLVGGFLISDWFVSRLEESAKEHLEAGRVSADGAFARLETEIQNYTKVMSRSVDLSDHIENRNLVEIRQDLLPEMVGFNLDFFEVLDGQGEVVLNNNGPYVETSNLSNLSMLQSAQVEMILVDLVNTPSGIILSGIAPVKHAGGKVGFVMAGYYLTPQLLDELKKISGHDISVFTEEQLVATTKKGKPEATCATSGCHAEGYTALISRKILKGAAIGPEYVDMLGEPYLISHARLRLHGEPVAFYTVLMPMKDVVRAQRITILSVVLLAVLVMSLIIAIGYLVAKTIAKPLQDLSVMAKKVTTGDLTPRSRYERKDEIGELAASFNQMTASLQSHTESLQRRVHELSTLYETGLAVSSTFDLDTLLKTVMDNVVKAFHVDYGSLMLLDRKTQELTIKVAHGLSESVIKKTRVKVGEQIAGRVAKDAQPLLLNKNDPNKELRPFLLKEHIASFVSVPLKYKDEVIGIINVGRRSTKPSFRQSNVHFLTTLSTQAAVAIKNVELFDELRKSYLAIVRSLAEIVDAKDRYTKGHSARVARYAAAIAKELGFAKFETDGIEIAAYLHDLGKIGISDGILRKPGKLTEEEMKAIKAHSKIGARILAPIKFPWDVLPIVYQHHERYAGGGYPENTRHHGIHIGARILFVADAYEAMTSERPYRRALSREEAIGELKKGSGSQFDPKVVKAFLNILKKEKMPRANRRKAS